jgi:hypothetical protein
MQGTVDPTTIDVWSSSLYNMGEQGKKYFSSPEAVLDYYFRHGWEKMVRLLFDDPMLSFMLSVKGAGAMVEENALHLTSFAYATNWAVYHAKAVKMVEKMKPKEGAKAPQPIDWSQPLNSAQVDRALDAMVAGNTVNPALERVPVNSIWDRVPSTDWMEVMPPMPIPRQPRVRATDRTVGVQARPAARPFLSEF